MHAWNTKSFDIIWIQWTLFTNVHNNSYQIRIMFFWCHTGKQCRCCYCISCGRLVSGTRRITPKVMPLILLCWQHLNRCWTLPINIIFFQPCYMWQSRKKIVWSREVTLNLHTEKKLHPLTNLNAGLWKVHCMYVHFFNNVIAAMETVLLCSLYLLWLLWK